MQGYTHNTTYGPVEVTFTNRSRSFSECDIIVTRGRKAWTLFLDHPTIEVTNIGDGSVVSMDYSQVGVSVMLADWNDHFGVRATDISLA